MTFEQRPIDQIAVQYKETNHWRTLSWPQYFDQIVTVAHALSQIQIKPKSRVAIMANTRLEWALIDHAVLGLGGWVVPIYQTATPEDLEYILNNSEAEVLILENRALLRVFQSISKNCSGVRKVICLDPVVDADVEFITWPEFIKAGDANTFSQDFKEACSKTQPHDVATILYTSGTTGIPKGVVLTHEAAFVEVSESFPLCGAVPRDTSLSFLPYAHILGRIEHWGHAYIGFTLAFAESIDKVRSNLIEIKPTFLMSVPRIFEKVYAAIQAQLKSNFALSKLSAWAVGVGLKVGEYKLRGSPLPLALALEYEIAKRTVLVKIKEAFGGRLRFAISGGAPISKEIALFFHACEVLILEGYGLTETTAAITVNTPFDYNFGSVGKPIGEALIKIAEDGEILIKSKKVMREYYKDPTATKAAFTDGWFHSGDIGEFTRQGDLRITDRKKDLIKTAGGKYVAPQRLEGLLKLHPFISNVLVHGDQRKYIVCLFTLNKEYILTWAKENLIPFQDYESLTQSAPVTELIRKAVADTNSRLANYETIKRFAILPDDFTVEAGELTPSLKVKRKLLDKKWADKIASLYN